MSLLTNDATSFVGMDFLMAQRHVMIKTQMTGTGVLQHVKSSLIGLAMDLDLDNVVSCQFAATVF